MNKPHLVLVPGLLCTERLWRDQISALGMDFDIQVARHHLDDSLGAIAERILDAAPERFSLAGLSFGGYVVFELWRRAPERIERIALLDTRATQDPPETVKEREDQLRLIEKGRFTGIHERLAPSFVHPDRRTDSRLIAEITGMAVETGKDGFIRQTRAIMGRPDSRPTCETIDVPALVLCGRQDERTPLRMHEEMASLIPDSWLEVVEDCGHLAPMERPAEVNVAMREWLAA